MPESDPMKVEHTILTVREVAEYLRLSEAKVYRLVNEGQLPVVRLGKTWRFRKDLLDNWLAEQSRQEMQAPGQWPEAAQANQDRRPAPDARKQEQPDGQE